ncbi:MAG: hypothetical protein H7315_14130 [Herminiimonas sp.]|nr:hypothetical protein [Herminiimonas sp.]
MDYDAAPANRKPGLPMRFGSALAQHAEVAVDRTRIAIVWKQCDGKATVMLGKLPVDAGQHWKEVDLGRTQGASDQPHLIATPTGIVVIWRTQRDGLIAKLTMEGTAAWTDSH